MNDKRIHNIVTKHGHEYSVIRIKTHMTQNISANHAGEETYQTGTDC